MERLGRVYIENHIKRIRRCCLALLIPLLFSQSITGQGGCPDGLTSTDGDENCPPEISVIGALDSEVVGWVSTPIEAVTYLSCFNCADPEFNYTGPPITDCNGQDFTFVASLLPTACNPLPAVYSTTFTLYPAPSGTIDLTCDGEVATLTFVPDLICQNYSYQWKDEDGNPLTGSGSTTTSYVVDPADDQTYSIMVMNNDLPPGCPAFTVSEVASCCILDVDCSALGDLSVQCASDAVPPATPELLVINSSCGNTSVTVLETEIATGNNCADDPTIIERVYTVTDDNGTPGDTSDDNIATCISTITIADTEGPAITFGPSDITMEYGDNVEQEFQDWLGFHAYADASDNCSDELLWLIDTPDPSIQYGCACTGSGTVMFSAVDQCGNSTSFSAVFYVEDTTAPIIVEDANSEIIQCAGGDYNDVFQAWLNNHGGAEATDDCDVIWTTDPPNPTMSDGCGETSNTLVTFIASDDCGNSATTTGRFRVVDTEVPVWTNLPVDMTISCDEEVVFTPPTAVDLCSEPVVTYTDVETPGDFCDGHSITRTWTARDGCQWESVEVSQTITLIDDQGPELTAVHPLLIGLNNFDTLTFECDDMTVFSPSDFAVVDNCDPNPLVMMMDPVLSSPQCEDGVVVQMLCVWIGKDICGNNTEFNVIINIVDNTAPVITDVPGDQTIECGETPDFSDDPPVAVDNCDDDLNINYIDTESSEGCNFTYTRTWYVIDHCGNYVTATQNFYFSDSSDPEFSDVPEDQTISCTDDVIFGEPTVSDDCTDVTLTFVDSSMTGSGTCLTSHTRVWTATDGCGNTASVSQTITAVDNMDPYFTFVPDDETVACGDSINFGTPIALDSCSAVTLTFVQEQTTGSGSCITSYIRTWTATDDCGLTATASQTITAIDDVAPEFTFVPADETIACGDSINFGMPMVSDNCSAVTLTVEDATGSGSCFTSYTRTWTATDVCGLSSTASQTITAVDNEAPVFTSVPEDGTLACGESPVFGTPTVSDDCGDVNLTSEDTDTVDGCTQTFTRTWTATDACGLSATASQTLTLTDDEVPVFADMPDDVTISCAEVPQFDTPEVTGSCGDVDVTFEDMTITKAGCTITFMRTWTATSVCGMTATAVQTIVTVDDNDPVFVDVPADATIGCGETPVFGSPSYSDLCSTDVTIDFTDSVVAEECTEQHTRTWTLDDGCGNTATASQTITVTNDGVAPVFTFVPEDLMLGCGASWEFGEPVVEDNCGNVTITFEDVDNGGNLFYGIDITRTWTATDACGNTATASQNAWIDGDQTAPVITSVPADQAITCDDEVIFGDIEAEDDCSDVVITFEDVQTGTDCAAGYEIIRTWTVTNDAGSTTTVSVTIYVVNPGVLGFTFIPESFTRGCDEAGDFGNPIASTKCPGELTTTYEDEMIAGDCTGAFELRRTWTVSDNCGAVGVCSQTITVEDLEAPVFTQMPENVTVNCFDESFFGEPVAEDNCNGGVVLSFEDNTVVDGCSEILSRTWTAADDCGNVKVATQTITRIDQVAPAFTFVPQDMNIGCNDVLPETVPVANDDCSEVSLAYSMNIVDSDCNKQYIRSWIATDACGNATQATQIITRIDDTAPAFTFVPQDMNISCSEDMPETVPVANDDCNNVSLAYSLEVIGTDCNKQYVRSWIATDACGNAAQATQIITVTDDEAPAFAYMPENLFVACGDPVEFATPEYTENCAADVSISFVDETTQGDCEAGQDYSVTRIWTISDACGNAVSATQTITVLAASTNLVFTNVPASLSLSCGQSVEFGTPEYYSNCAGNVALSHSDELAVEGCMEIHTRTWTASDDCDNAVLASQTIMVVDDLAPVYSGELSDYNVTCNEAIVYGTPQVADNCGEVSLSFEDSQMTVGCSTVYTRTWIAIDACGNESYRNQNITVVDELAPQFSTAVEESTIACDDALVFATMEATDDCSDVVITFEDNVTSSGCVATHTRTWTATDACGNMAFAEQVINIEDRDAPIFLTDLGLSVMNCNETVEFITPEVADNCSSATVTFEDDVLIEGCDEVHTRTWTATDACGNVANAQQIIRVEDIEAPVFSNLVVESSADCGIINFTPPSVTDNCNLIDITFQDEISETPGCETVHTRTWTATDACGNVATAQQFISVQDNVPPVFTYVPAGEVLSCNEDVEFDTPEISDNCSEVTLDFVDEEIAGNTPGEYQLVRTWIASDACGNQATAEQVFSVQDFVAPDFAVYSGETFVIPASEFSLSWEPGFSVFDDCSESLDLQGPAITRESVCNGLLYTYTYTAVDLAGNTTEQTFQVNVVTNTNCEGIASLGEATTDRFEERLPETKHALLSDLRIAPNPASDLFVVRFFSDTKNVDTEITLYNMFGQREYTYTHSSVQGENIVPIRVDHLAEGNYFVRFRAGDEVTTQQISITP